MSIPEYVVDWLNEEGATWENNSLIRVSHIIREKLHQQHIGSEEVAKIMTSLVPLDLFAYGKMPGTWDRLFRSQPEAENAQEMDWDPRFSDFDATTVEDWKKLAAQLKQARLKACFAYAVWELGRKISPKQKLYQFGLLAAESYLQAALEAGDAASFVCVWWATQSIQLALALKNEAALSRGFEYMMGLADAAEPNQIGMWFAPFHKLIEEPGLPKEHQNRIVEALEKRLDDAVARDDLHPLLSGYFFRRLGNAIHCSMMPPLVSGTI